MCIFPSHNLRHMAKTALNAALASSATIGGQAVIEGVMMRNKQRMAIAVRRADGTISMERKPWFVLTKNAWAKKPFLRGFPILLETLVNGIKSLNWSASTAVEEETGEEFSFLAIALTMVLAMGLAILMFVVLPHVFSLGMAALGLGGATEGITFHIWDGFFKVAIFLGYVLTISRLPDIQRVFEYHGAEHKVIWTHENGLELTPDTAKKFSRLHPRCGTAFLLYVLTLAILLHALFIPLVLFIYTPENTAVKHIYLLIIKIFMMIPIAALAYELIKFTGKKSEQGIWKILCLPGLCLQRMTTKEPDEKQLEVAIAALKGALKEEA